MFSDYLITNFSIFEAFEFEIISVNIIPKKKYLSLYHKILKS